MEWFTAQGATVCVPVGHSPDLDFVAVLDSRPLRVQVKTSTCWAKDRYTVSLCTRGGNQSWNRVIKRLDADLFDLLFVVVTDGRRWCIPSGRLHDRSGLVLGGPKYSEFEVEPGLPLVDASGAEKPSRIAVS